MWASWLNIGGNRSHSDHRAGPEGAREPHPPRRHRHRRQDGRRRRAPHPDPPQALPPSDLAKLGARVEPRPQHRPRRRHGLPPARGRTRPREVPAHRRGSPPATTSWSLYGWREGPRRSLRRSATRRTQARPRHRAGPLRPPRQSMSGRTSSNDAIYLCRKVVEGSILHRRIQRSSTSAPCPRGRSSTRACSSPRSFPSFYLDLKSPDFEIRARRAPPALLHEHLPAVAPGPALPHALPQRRNQHAGGESELDARPRGRDGLSRLGAPRQAAASGDPAGRFGFGHARQHARGPRPRRPAASSTASAC
jgi:hypothetical protein